MAKNKILFENFLTDKRVYHLNQNFWKNSVRNHLKKEKVKSENWLNDRYANGQKMYDGNPIYSLLLDAQKAVRIIQEEPECTSPEISAWIKATEDDQQNIMQELVIVLELSNKTKQVALDFIRNWAEKEVQPSDMEELINQKLKNLATLN